MLLWTGLVGLSEDEEKTLRGPWHESDRAAAIISAAVLEDSLNKAIQCCLRSPKTEGVRAQQSLDKMFMPSGPLGIFSAKIDLGYLLRLYDQIVQRELTTIKDVRNTFAHKLNVQKFDKQQIKN